MHVIFKEPVCLLFKYQCTACLKKFRTQKEIEEVELVEPIHIYKYACPDCGMTFSDPSEMEADSIGINEDGDADATQVG